MEEVIYRGNVRVGSKKLKVLQRTKGLVLLRRNGVLLLEKSSGSRGKTVAELVNVECVTKCSEDPCKVRLHFRGPVGASGSSSQLDLRAASPEECDKWHRILVDACNCPGVALPTTPRPSQLSVRSRLDQTTVTGKHFFVHMLPASTVDIYGPCLLEVTDVAVVLLDVSDPGKRLLGWPLASLRRYGHDQDKFHFESGRSCETGEGHFAFTSKESAVICTRIHEQSLRLAECRGTGSQSPSISPCPIGGGGLDRPLPAEPPRSQRVQYMNEPEYLPVIGSDGGRDMARRPLPPRPAQ